MKLADFGVIDEITLLIIENVPMHSFCDLLEHNIEQFSDIFAAKRYINSTSP